MTRCFPAYRIAAARSLLAVATWALTSAAVSGCTPHLRIEELPPEQIETTLFLIGDAGEPDPRHAETALDSMSAQAAVAPSRSLIVYLGDNVYPNGIEEEGRAEYADSRRRLEAQVEAVPRGVRGIFIPGNHDWAGMTAFGLYSVRLQEQMLKSLAGGRDIRMLPGNGCPGPVTFDVGRLQLIAIDTQWWLHDYIVRDAQSNCATPTTVGAVTAALREQVGRKRDGRVTIVAGHHPLMTGGPHGGYCGVSGPFRRLGGNSQDILSSPNRAMRDSIEAAFRGQAPLAYAAGHDHNLQVLRGGPNVDYILVSGAGSASKGECGVRLRESYYVSQHRAGFMRVDILRNKGVLLRVYHFPSKRKGGLSFTRWLEPA